MNNHYPNLFKPMKIGSKTAKNRIIMSPMDDNMAKIDGTLTKELIAYYEERAKGGAGIIMTGMVSVDNKHGKLSKYQATMDHDRHVLGFKELAQRVHQHNALLIPQIGHSGWSTDEEILGGNAIKAVSYGAFAKMVRTNIKKKSGSNSSDSKVEILSTEELDQIVDSFINTALLMKKAGCDGIEVHAAHFYIITQLHFKLMNQRKDKYGGSFYNRSRFAREVVKGIREACGNNFIIAVRIGARDYLPLGLGLSPKHRLEFTKMMESAGADMIDISIGIDPHFKKAALIEPQGFKEGFRSHLAKPFKEQLNIPVTTVGVLRTPAFCESLLKDEIVDFISIGRGLIADPFWPNKAFANNEHEIRKCISCNEGCIGPVLLGHHVPIRCTVNPRAGRESEIHNKPAYSKKVVIIGGGPSGMQAAITAKEQGHDMTILERENKLGGQLKLASIPPDKEFINWATDWFKMRIDDLGIKVVFNVNSPIDYVKTIKPDQIILAVGSEPFSPPIKGIKDTISSWDILKGKFVINNEKVLVIGGGLVGTETALYLADQGNKVSIVEMGDALASGLEPISRTHLMNSIKQRKIKVTTEAQVNDISNSFVNVTHNGRSKKVAATSVVVATGQKSIGEQLYNELIELGYNVNRIGDSNKVGKIITAVEDGYFAALNL